MNNISITFRHVEPSDAIKQHVEDKVQKLQHGAEIRLSSGGEHLEAHEVCEDMYIAIDRAVQKLERQISGSKGSAQSKQRRGGETVRNGLTPDTEDTTVES